jgi:hypothetical protein
MAGGLDGWRFGWLAVWMAGGGGMDPEDTRVGWSTVVYIDDMHSTDLQTNQAKVFASTVLTK